MNARRVRAVARKEFIHVYRDPRSLGMALAIPVLLIVLFGYALTLDVDNVPLTVWDQSNTAESRSLLAAFDGSRFFSLQGMAMNYSEVEQAINDGRVKMAIVIPRSFGADIRAEKPAALQAIVDGSDSNTATIALGYASAVAGAYSQGVLIDRIERMGGHTPQWPIEIRTRVWFNEDMKSRNFIIPGLVAVILSVIAALLTSLTIAREWERGTMEQLISTPVRPMELIIGKLLPYAAIGLADLTIAVAMALFLFDVPLRGSAVLLFVISSVFLLAALAQGIIISIIAKNQLMASQIAILSTFLPAFLLSGFAFAISNMPTFLQYVTYIVPARYIVTILKGIFLKGVGIEVLYSEMLFLSLAAPILLFVASRKFRKKLE